MKRLDPEIKAMRAVGRVLSKVPKDAALRLLAFFSCRELGVDTWYGAEMMYREAAAARERKK